MSRQMYYRVQAVRLTSLMYWHLISPATAFIRQQPCSKQALLGINATRLHSL